MVGDIEDWVEPLRRVQAAIRERVVAACEESAAEELSRPAGDDGDTIYSIDRVGEEVLVEEIERATASIGPILLIAEGIAGGSIVLPRGASPANAEWRLIVDPIDGTRGLMHQKRSGWVLAGLARNRGSGTCLRDIELAVQTEIPLVKQHLCDVAWAVRGRGARAVRVNRLDGTESTLTLHPSRAPDIEHGFATVVRFFPEARGELGALDEELMSRLVSSSPGRASTFEDQYISTGGQLFELMIGHDRFVADLRPLLAAVRGGVRPACAHPYDLATVLVAEEAGVIVTDPRGVPVDAPLDVSGDVAWIGYANESLRRTIEPALGRVLVRRGLLPPPEPEPPTAP